MSGVMNSSAERSCVCVQVVETSRTDGNFETPMERVKERGREVLKIHF